MSEPLTKERRGAASLRALGLPSLQTEGRAHRRRQRHLIYWTRGSYTKNLERHPHCVQQTVRRTWRYSQLLSGEGGYHL